MGLIRRQVDPGTSGVGLGSQEGALLVIFMSLQLLRGGMKQRGSWLKGFSALRDQLAPEGGNWLSSYLLAACKKNVWHSLTEDSFTYFS